MYRAQLDKDAWLSRKEANYEARMVRLVLKHFGLQAKEKELIKQSFTHTGKGSLTFDGLLQECPGFPVRLGARDIPYVFQISLNDLRRRFTRTKPYQAYEDLVDDKLVGCHTSVSGLIFHWPEFGEVVLHDDKTLDVSGFRMSWTIGRPAKPVFLDLLADNQKQTGFLYALSRVWTPS